jgi:hypothetical protein
MLGFPSPWVVKSDAKVAPLSVEIPGLVLQKKNIELLKQGVQVDPESPKFLRLEMRRQGLRGKMAPRPVLKADMADGVTNDWLTVSSSSFDQSITSPTGAIAVTSASERDFRKYRFRRSLGSLFGAVASIISGLLVGLGTAGIGGGVSKGLLIAGGVLAILAAVTLMASAWRAPVE